MKKIILSLLIISPISFSSYFELEKYVRENNLQSVIKLESKGENMYIKDYILGKNMLGYAIYHKSYNVANYFIQNYKDMINDRGDDQMLPIEDAVLKENPQILLNLLKNGAKIRIKNNKGHDVYTLATKFGKGKMVKILRDFELKKK